MKSELDQLMAEQNIAHTSVPRPGDHTSDSSFFRSSGWIIRVTLSFEIDIAIGSLFSDSI